MLQVKQPVEIRWIDTEDELAAVVGIERSCFGSDAWSEQQFECFSDNPANVFKILLQKKQVIGYLLYTVSERTARIRKLVIAPDYQRQGCGRRTISYLRRTMQMRHRDKLIVELPERAVEGQLFFKACGFEWYQTLHGPRDTDSTYRFRCAL